MIKTTTLLSRAGLAALSPASRALLLVGGALTGGLIAASASYGVVSLLYPRQATPVVIAAPVALPDLATETTIAARPRIDVAPLDLPEQTNAVAEQAPLLLAPVEQVADALPDPVGDVIFTTKSEPTIALPDTDVALDTIAPPTLPITLAAAPLAAADMPRLRPAARPDDFAAIAALADKPATIPALRPQPRPETVQLAAAEAPSARSSAPRASNASARCGATLAGAIPRRPSGATTGSAFFAALGGTSGTDRDQRVINELAGGNVPGFLRDLQPVTLRGQDARGAETEIVICVTPDYLALGSDRDYVRVPLGLPAAARIAGRFDMTLPTPRMVDAIYAQADVRLSPSPMQAGPQMSSTNYFLRHNATIEGQLHGRSGLVAGQKKDVVMASRMANAPGRVAIYGWHRSATSPIQPVSTVHGQNYADYSHGIRLVSKTAFLNGRAVSLDELLGSSRYAYLLNSDGPLPGPVIRTASR